jgi:hypothetical protein
MRPICERLGYTKSQWEESVKSAKAAVRAAEAAEKAVTEAQLSRKHASVDAQHARETSDAQSRAAAEVIQQQITASERQSRAALNASIDASQRDQRAWVSVTVTASSKYDNRTFTANDIVIHFHNTGRTPAITSLNESSHSANNRRATTLGILAAYRTIR